MTVNSLIEGTISEICCNERNITIYLPKEYDLLPHHDFPIILLQDGDFLFKDSLIFIEENVRKGIAAPIILAGIYSERRNDEYTPWPQPALADKYPPFAGEGDAYLHTIEHEILPWIRTHYRISTDPNDRAIGGASLGGLISIYAMYKKNTLFKKFMLLSSSLWYEGFIEFMRSDQLDPTLQAYMYIGDMEGITKTNIQRHMITSNNIGYDILYEKLESPSKQIRFESDPEGTHEDSYFILYCIRGLSFLFPG
ncbi:alpha/beta hydrolase [Paenibacillus glacialis]|uniref:Esterase n=1 Tax=Paenibacillus glacialis TaxID=494026 RepID=A0A168C0N8_9BACL|nr:alpha/beta hydrolase-fold protein [Paenibacillus glacialis]OAB32948.1 hypothetical protein PGLA_26065 [Paenibacillus glacialis]